MVSLTSTRNTITSGIKIAILGISGVGKTYSLRNCRNAVLVDLEKGSLCLNQYDIDRIAINTFEEIYEVYDWFINGEGQKYDTIIFDSGSEAAELKLADEKKNEKDPRKAYLTMGESMLNLFKTFRDIPNKNVVFIFKEGMVKDEETGRIYHSAMLPGSKISAQVPYLFDEVLRVVALTNEDGTVSRWYQTFSDERSIEKDRSGKLEPYEEADLQKAIDKIKGVSNAEG